MAGGSKYTFIYIQLFSAGAHPEGTNGTGEVGVCADCGVGWTQRGEFKVASKYYYY